jgi:membrane protease subunit HflC
MSRTAIAAIIAAVALLLVWNSLFIVEQTEQAIVLQFGEFKREVREPGLKLKTPFVQNVIYYDMRVLDFEPPPEEVIAGDQKRMVVDSFARFRIIDPLQFYRSVNSEQGARVRLRSTISDALRGVLGSVTLASVLSEERDRIMRQITELVATQAKGFGIDVIDVRLRRADLPEENSQAIYARMQSERQREAAEFRAQGAEFAQRIRSIAERERTVILAEAQRQSQVLRGQGDGESVKIYADAFGKDPEFFAFYRSMQAYRDALAGHDTTLVLSPDGEFFRYFGSSGARSGGTPQSATVPPPVAPPSTGSSLAK